MTSKETLCSVGAVTVGLGVLRPPKRVGREMSSLSMSLMSALPVWLVGAAVRLHPQVRGCKHCCATLTVRMR